jgi:o-aminophenol oxidase
MHIHLVHFKLLARDAYSEVQRLPEATDEADGGGYEIHFDPSAAPIQLDQADTGWKDTIRVDPAEMVTLAVPFKHYADTDTEPAQGERLYMTGRYMYHCHILEHEDHEMMRPFVVMPPEAIDHMHNMGHSMGDDMDNDMGGAATNSSAGWYMPPDLGNCIKN